MSLFGMEIGKRAIAAQQIALEVTGHNISNTNTPGYTRQIPNLVTTIPYHTPTLTNNTKVGQLGTGVTVADIERIRDAFLDQQIRNEAKTSGYWSSMQNALAQVEVILNEPSTDGLRSVMDMYWESWQDLVSHPESEAVRTTVAERGMALADGFNHMHKQLTELREDLNASVKIKVDEINTITSQLADLNVQILSIKIAGKQPNDLEDKRDMLLDQLSQIVDIKTFTDSNGMIAVQLGGRALVQGTDNTVLATETDTKGMYLVTWEDTKARAQIESGELRGFLDARGRTELDKEKESPGKPSEYKEVVPNLLNNLNNLAKTIITKTNELHRGGYSLNNKGIYPDGKNFFEEVNTGDVEWAAILKVEEDILNNPINIAVAKAPTFNNEGEKANFGDARIAMEIANLKHNFNNSEWRVKLPNWTGLLSGVLPVDINPSFDISGTTVNVDATVSNMSELAAAIQAAIDDAGLEIKVRLEGSDINMISNTIFTVDWSGNYEATEHKGAISSATVDDYWRSVCANVGVKSQEAIRMTTNQEVLLSELEGKRQSISGVSLDEELINMIKFQHAYNAASRFITTIDEAIDVIVNRMGIVGR
ncbi:MAG TPA: flagellar hook-associated protein FlgK [Syntrophomonadaceae bacterium]|nr:flagellar hook-associated protein FlgK [Syntrophomonadaceae bacterium]